MLPRMTMVSTSSGRTAWAGLATLARLTRTLPSWTSCAARVRDLAMRANQSHLSSRWAATGSVCAPPAGCGWPVIDGESFLAALLQRGLEGTQRRERRVGIEGCCFLLGRRHMQGNSRPLLPLVGPTAASIG